MLPVTSMASTANVLFELSPLASVLGTASAAKLIGCAVDSVRRAEDAVDLDVAVAARVGVAEVQVVAESACVCFGALQVIEEEVDILPGRRQARRVLCEQEVEPRVRRVRTNVVGDHPCLDGGA